MKYKIKEDKDMKIFNSEDYNYVFNKSNGHFMRWGKTFDDDAVYSQFGPEILDIEVSTICHQGCSFCYKSNTANGTYMNFETYKNVLDKMPKVLTQVAFGLGDWDSNPDLKKIVQYTWSKGIIPNITINGFRMNDEDIKWAAKNFGAIAVSNYDKDACYGMIDKLTSYGLKQCNIHQLLAEETFDKCFHLLNDKLSDPRLKNLNAIVFLSLKKKGNRNTFHSIKDLNRYKNMINFAIDNKIGFGFDSCGASKFLNAVKDSKDYNDYVRMAEPCESSLFSAYIDTHGKYYPCSFCEEEQEWKNGIDVVKCNDFIEDVWNNEKTKEFREKMLKCVDCNNCRKCVMFEV